LFQAFELSWAGLAKTSNISIFNDGSSALSSTASVELMMPAPTSTTSEVVSVCCVAVIAAKRYALDRARGIDDFSFGQYSRGEEMRAYPQTLLKS